MTPPYTQAEPVGASGSRADEAYYEAVASSTEVDRSSDSDFSPDSEPSSDDARTAFKLKLEQDDLDAIEEAKEALRLAEERKLIKQQEQKKQRKALRAVKRAARKAKLEAVQSSPEMSLAPSPEDDPGLFDTAARAPPKPVSFGFAAAPVAGSGVFAFKRKRVVESPLKTPEAAPPTKRAAVVKPEAMETGGPHARKITISNKRTVTIDLVSDDDGTPDPIAAHIAMNRVCKVMRNSAAAADEITSALGVMSGCHTKMRESPLDALAGTGVRTALRMLVDLPLEMTCPDTRRAARELIRLDNSMRDNMRGLVASLRVNPLVRDVTYEKYLRDNKCPVCWGAFEKLISRGVKVLRFSCDHAVCNNCTAQWECKDDMRCPICRKKNQDCKLADEEQPLGGRLGPARGWGEDLDEQDLRSIDTESDDCGDDGAYHGRVSSDVVTGSRVTRSTSRENERKGRNPYAEP